MSSQEREISLRIHRDPIVLPREAISVLPQECIEALWALSESCEIHLTPEDLSITPLTTEICEIRSHGWTTYIIPCGRARRVRVVVIDYNPSGPEALFRVFDLERTSVGDVVRELERILSEEITRLKRKKRDKAEQELRDVLSEIERFLSEVARTP